MGQIGAAVLSGPGEPGAAGGNRHPQTLGDLLVGQPFLVEQEQNFPVPGGELDRQHLGQPQGRGRRRCQTGGGGMEGLFLGGLLHWLILRLNREQQITVLISSHILDELAKLATHYGFIDGGRIVREISAEDLEAACRKCVRVEVSDTKALARVLDTMGAEYKILDNRRADVFAQVNVSQLTLALAREQCEVVSLHEHDESLESYYVSLVGGVRHA